MSSSIVDESIIFGLLVTLRCHRSMLHVWILCSTYYSCDSIDDSKEFCMLESNFVCSIQQTGIIYVAKNCKTYFSIVVYFFSTIAPLTKVGEYRVEADRHELQSILA